MTPSCLIADPSGLVAMAGLIPDNRRVSCWGDLTTAVRNNRLRFPPEVAGELAVTARNEQISSWAAGLGVALDPYKSNIDYQRMVMRYVTELGFEEGFGNFADPTKDPALSFVALLACEYKDAGVDFAVMTNDFGTLPLGPTAEQLCGAAGWAVMKPVDALDYLGLS